MKRVLIQFSNKISRRRARYIHRELDCKDAGLMFLLRALNILIYTLPRLRNRSIARQFMKSLSSERNAPMALLIGNSPSSNRLNAGRIKELQKNRTLDVFVMNSFYKSSLNLRISPDFIILSDPAHLTIWNSSDNLWAWLRKNQTIKIICPTSWKSTLESEPSIRNPIYYFNDDEALLKTGSIKPTKPRPYPSLTAMKGMAVVGSLGYGKINIIGIDNSQFESFECDGNNRIILSSNHNAPDYQPALNLTEIWNFSSADYFYDLSVIFRAFRYFKTLPIVNLNPESYVDTFEKVHESELVQPEFWFTSKKS